FFQAEDGIRDFHVTGVQTCALPILSNEEIVQGCILALVNEGARILDEGFAESAEDIDRVYRFGYGFPAERGGPMAYADSLGLDRSEERRVGKERSAPRTAAQSYQTT